MNRWTLMLASLAALAPAADLEAAAPVADLPVKEVTVFKDGHAFMLHEGEAATDSDGNVVLDRLPTPIIGTFMAYAAKGPAALESVTTGRRIVDVARTALSIPELIRANVGRRLRIREAEPVGTYEGTLAGVPERSTEETRRTSPPGTPDALPVAGQIVLLKTEAGVRAVPIERIEEVTFLDDPATAVTLPEFRERMVLGLDWGGARPAAKARVGMMYVERGIRWIPSYRVELDGKGKARLKLQATLVNELADLEGVKVHLVIGVPTFAFEGTPDPISLREAVARLSSAFREDSQTAYAFSNAIMTQRAMPVDRRHARPAESGRAVDLGPDIATSGQAEDLYVFTLEAVSLAKGERLVLPVTEFELPYETVFTLDLPFAPPAELRRQRHNSQQEAELARLMHGPKVMHVVRLTNTSRAPLTTAPALLLREGRILAQGLMTYTAPGAATDLEVTAAVDIPIRSADHETDRVPNVENWHGVTVDRINLEGRVSLTNHRGETVQVEVMRSVLGKIESASRDGRITHLGHHEGWTAGGDWPSWWYGYSWPWWWYRFNAVGRVAWDVTLEPDESVELAYTWHYYWD